MLNTQVFTYVKLALALLFGAPTPDVAPQQTWSAPPISTPALLEIQVDVSELRRMVQAQSAFSTLIMNGLTPKESFDQSLATLSALAPLDQLTVREVLMKTERVGLWLYGVNVHSESPQMIITLDSSVERDVYEQLFKLLDIAKLTEPRDYRGLKLHRFNMSGRPYGRRGKPAALFQDGSRAVIVSGPALLDQYLAHRKRGAQPPIMTERLTVSRLKVKSGRTLHVFNSLLSQRELKDWYMLSQALNIGAAQELLIELTRTGIDASLTLDPDAPVTKTWDLLTEHSSHLLEITSSDAALIATWPFNNVSEVLRRLTSSATLAMSDKEKRSVNKKINREIKRSFGDGFSDFTSHVRAVAIAAPDLNTPLLLIETDSSASALKWAPMILSNKGSVTSKEVRGSILFSGGAFQIYVKGPFMITPLNVVAEDVFIKLLDAMPQVPSTELNDIFKRVTPKAQAIFAVNLSDILKTQFNVQSEQVDRILGGLWMTRAQDQATLNAHIRFPDLKALNQLIIQQSMRMFMR